jgi:hypothetical protein
MKEFNEERKFGTKKCKAPEGLAWFMKVREVR